MHNSGWQAGQAARLVAWFKVVLGNSGECRSVSGGAVNIVNRKFIKVVRTGNDYKWGNVFLTASWTLYIDRTNQQHDAAMERLMIDPQTVLISGAFNPHGLGFRASPALDRGDLSEIVVMGLQKTIREIVAECT